MSQEPNRVARLLVLVGPDESAVRTVEHALREARDSRAEFDAPVAVDVFLLVPGDDPSVGTETRARIEERLLGDPEGDESRSRVEVITLGGGDAVDPVDAVRSRVGTREMIRVVLPSDSGIPIERLREAFGVTRVEIVSAEVSRERRRLLHPGGVRRLATIFGLTYLFYLAIGGFVGGLDLLTGAISAAVVALSLSNVALSEEPTVGRTGRRLVRVGLFLPVLLWEVVKANVTIAYVILHPRLPIDPSMGTLETDTREGLERMVLANSITLTPGTLVVDVDGRTFTVHSLTSGARTDLAKGRLQRLVAWVFHGGPGDGRAVERGGGER